MFTVCRITCFYREVIRHPTVFFNELDIFVGYPVIDIGEHIVGSDRMTDRDTPGMTVVDPGTDINNGFSGGIGKPAQW